MKARYSEFRSLGGPVSEAQTALEIGKKLEALPGFRTASTVLLYASVPGEVPTQEWIGKWKEAKRIVLPRVVGDSLELREYVPGLLQEGKFGIEEPAPSAPQVDPGEIDFAVIPGVAFDREGRRLGHGCGYYDRVLSRLSCLKVGVALPFRIVEKVPADEMDVKMDMVIW